MSRINTNVQSLIAQRVLGQNNNGLSQSLERLSTGLRINRGKDDPAGLIASERLRSEKASLTSAIGNADRADQVVNIAEGGLSEVSGLLVELQGLVTTTANSAGLSTDEKKANQLQIDSILQTIDRVATSTTFQGKRLLNGSLDYQTNTVNSGVQSFKVNGAKVTSAGLDVQAIVTQSAQQAGLYLSAGGTSLNFGGSASGIFTVEISGSKGSRELSFASGTALTDVAKAINSFTNVTGVKATASSTGLSLRSSEFGKSEFVSVRTVSTPSGLVGGGIYGFNATDANTVDSSTGTAYAAATNGKRDEGQDIGATINGIQATSNGKTVRVNTDFLDVEVTFLTGKAQTLQAVNAFNISGGGADFQLAGQVDIAGRVAIGIQNVATRKLGATANSGGSLEFLSSLASGQANNVVDTKDLSNAQKIVAGAIDEVNTLRGRLGAFQKNTIGATVRSLGVSLENTTAAESSIRDANFASETASLTRNQILVQAATNVLGIANQSPQAALSLLRG